MQRKEQQHSPLTALRCWSFSSENNNKTWPLPKKSTVIFGLIVLYWYSSGKINNNSWSVQNGIQYNTTNIHLAHLSAILRQLLWYMCCVVLVLRVNLKIRLFPLLPCTPSSVTLLPFLCYHAPLPLLPCSPSSVSLLPFLWYHAPLPLLVCSPSSVTLLPFLC